MAQYQSFPDAAGASRTLEKLKALKMPSLANRTFLDVGCNEGFFCGFAKFQGAERVVGIDQSKLFIDRARQRFEGCEFYKQSWDELPRGSFDVILLASALHYADDQQSLIQRLVELLSPDGVLVLELGIASSPKSEWVNVQRGIDERLFPTMPLLREILASYAWKWMGPSIPQEGDPVARHVVHITRRRPVAYLLLQPPGYGKTSIANSLFARAGVKVVSGDDLVLQIVNGRKKAPEALRKILAENFSVFEIDRAIRRAFDNGFGTDLARSWVGEAGPGDFALDVYVPAEQQGEIDNFLANAGYMPVALQWERVGALLQSAQVLNEQAESYFMSLTQPAEASADGMRGLAAYSGGAAGFVDEVSVMGDRVFIRGWAVDERGAAPSLLAIKHDGKVHTIRSYERQPRPDVQRYLGLPHSLYGYVTSLPSSTAGELRDVLDSLEVRVGNAEGHLGSPLSFSSSLAGRKQ